MARDKGLEHLLNDDLAMHPHITGKAMFGGWLWLMNGNLLCGARHDGMLVRLGKGNDAWALRTPGIVAMVSGSRQMHGWVRASPEAYGDDTLRGRLIDSALAFVQSLPAK